ncbi:MAG: glycosyltransferase, partial [Actinobacteria bacterium]|nr:glycosyltransferase [Actinomycetota bacterium]
MPCYNEARRLDGSTFVEGSKLFAALVFVDDGSTDATASLLETTVRGVVDGGGVSSLVTMDRNAGKGEAVRRGVKVALELVGPQHPVAFADADLSTPLDEIVRLTGLLRALDRDVVIGSR